MTTEAAAETGPLSMDAAVALMTAPVAEPEKIEQPAAIEAEAAPVEAAAEDPQAVGEGEGEGEGTQSESATTDDDAGEAEQPGDGEGVDEPPEAAADPVDAPQWWEADKKAMFAQLPPELQATVKAMEDRREALTAKSRQEAAEARKQAETEVSGVKALAEQLSTFLPQAVETFKSKWDAIDWDGWEDRVQNEEDPDIAARDLMALNKARLAMSREQTELQKLQKAKSDADEIARSNFLREEGEKLLTLAPELAKPENLKALGGYLVEAGLPPEEFANAGALHLSLAHKAMLWDQAQAAAKAKAATPTPKPLTPPVRTVAPVAAPAQAANPVNREIQRLNNRLSQTHSEDDAVALIMAMSQKGRGQ